MKIMLKISHKSAALVLWGIVLTAAQISTASAYDCASLPPNVTQSGNEFRVTPTGGDDTVTVQLAVDCATQMSPSAVLLGPGQFRWTQIIARGWVDGRFEGAGADFGLAGAGNPPYVDHVKNLGRYTYIDVVGENSIPVYSGPDFTPSPGEPYPPGSAAMFVLEGGGDIEIAHLTWEVIEPHPAQPHRAIHGLGIEDVLDYMVLVTYRPPSDASPSEGVWVHDTMFKSLWEYPGIPFGTNVRIGLALDGSMITPGVYVPGDTGLVTSTPFTGSHLVTDCVFDGPAINTESGGLVGGSVTWAQNRFMNGNFGILFLDHDDSVFNLDDNDLTDHGVYGVAAWQRLGAPRLDRVPGFRIPAAPSVVYIDDNDISGAGDTGIDFTDGAIYFGLPGETIVGEIAHNDILAQDGTWAGIGIWGVEGALSVEDNLVDGLLGHGILLYVTDGVEVEDNRIEGSGGNAISVLYSNGCEIVDTNLSNWTGETDIWILDSTNCSVFDSGVVTEIP
jgi:hypothetical protein